MVILDFKQAELFLNHSLLYGNPSLLVIGKNGIGKSAMVESMIKEFNKKVRYVDNIEYGGMKQQVIEMQHTKEKIIAIPDLNRILSRKANVRDATLGYMASLISEGVMNSMTFNRELLPYEKKMKSKKINFIIPATPHHIVKLVGMQQYDFLNRFIILDAYRDASDFNPNRYQLHINPIFKYDKEIYNNYNNQTFGNMSMRFTTYLNVLIKGFNAMGLDGTNFLKSAKPKVYEPMVGKEIADLNVILKPLI